MNDEKRRGPNFAEFGRAGRSTYLRVDLDTIFNNINILRSRCSTNTEVIAVVKANAYGHGSVEVARFLESRGIKHFAVATPEEGAQIRQAGIRGSVQILGNATIEDIPSLIENRLTPTVAEEEFLEQYTSALTQNRGSGNGTQCRTDGQVVIKVDTGMSRNGCQPKQLGALVNSCKDHNLMVHSIMTHFSQAWDNPDFTRRQLDVFMQCAGQYRQCGIKLHVSNSAAIIQGYGTDLDYIRPGICMYGLPPDSSDETVKCVKTLGIEPALSWVAHPTLVKQLPPGSHVGYDNTYTTSTTETIATFALGYADGFSRQLSGKFSISLEQNGVTCPVVGRVSMDAITVKMDTHSRTKNTIFYIYRDNFSSTNSVTQTARLLDTIPYEVGTSLAARLPRVFVSGGEVVAVTKSLITSQTSDDGKRKIKTNRVSTV